MAERGKFIVLYGANNLGKSVQAEMLRNSLSEQGIKVQSLKYPIYDLEPTGPIINAVLRQGRKMGDFELQQYYAQNRLDFEPTLVDSLKKGIWTVGEDYTGTGIAWGMTKGVSLEDLEEMNKGLLVEDLAILFYGERFTAGIEKNHRNESDSDAWKRAQDIHLRLADRYGWQKVYANRAREKVHADIMKIVRESLF